MNAGTGKFFVIESISSMEDYMKTSYLIVTGIFLAFVACSCFIAFKMMFTFEFVGFICWLLKVMGLS